MSPELRLTLDIKSAIDTDWQEFSTLIESPSVQEFASFESRYADDHLVTENPLSIIAFQPTEEQFDSHNAARFLDEAYERADQFSQGLVAAFCEHKRVPIPETTDIEAQNSILANIFAGGYSKIGQYVVRSESLPDPYLHLSFEPQLNHMSTTLFMIAARAKTAQFYSHEQGANYVETQAPQAEIDATVDEAFQQACLKIIKGQKIVAAKGVDTADQLFANSMNVIRTLYHQGKDANFQRTLFNSKLFDYIAPKVERADYKTELEYATARQRIAFDAMAERFNDSIGTTYAFPGLARLNKQFQARDKYQKEWNLERVESDLMKVIATLRSTHASRHLVHAIADGTISYGAVSRAMMKLRETPLEAIELPTAELQEETLDWEVLPDDVGVYGARDTPQEARAEGTPAQLDEERINRLKAFGTGWKGARIMRGIPVSKQEKGTIKDSYYVLMLPEELETPLDDGTTRIEHAVADSPKTGHGLYVFRAEQGLGYNPRITWREVFSQRRGEPVKQLGALCLRHVASLETNMLNALTCKPDEIEKRRRYLLGQRLARRAAQQATV